MIQLVKKSIHRLWSPLSTDERRRFFEIIAMVLVTLALLGVSRLEGTLFELSERLAQHKDFLTTIIFFGLININVILILVLSFLIFRNVIKLVVERRRGVFGSRVRTKLVVALIFFALAPTAVLFYVSTRFLTESFETWFSSKVETTIRNTQEAGALVYKRDKRRLESLSRIALQRIDIVGAAPFGPSEGAYIVPNRLDGFDQDYKLDSIRVYNVHGKLVWRSNAGREDLKHGEQAPLFVLNSIDRFLRNPGMTSRGIVEVEGGKDVVRGIAPIFDARKNQLLGVVIAEERFDSQIIQSMDAILREFAGLRPGAQLIRLSYTVLLVLMVMIIVFSATWLGFYVARSIVGPIQSLAEATREVALGNYDIELKAKSQDETGQLVNAFNRMIRDLKTNEDQVRSFTLQLQHTAEELDRRRKYTEVILKNISAGVIAIDAKGCVTSVNNAAQRLLHINPAEILNKPITAALDPELLNSFWLPIAEKLTESQAFIGQMEIEKGNRQIHLIANASHVFDEQHVDHGIVVVFDDAGEQIKTQRVAAWREVARRLAHEIKNPITPIKLNAQRLLRRYGERFEGQDRTVFEDSLGTIVAEVDQLRDLVNEFSKFSRLPSVKTQLEDIDEVLREVCNFYSVSYPHIQFDVSGLSGRLPKVPLDKEQMNRVFSNLVANAVAAIDGNGKEGTIAFHSMLLPNLNTIRVEVIDNGPGIPEKLRTRVLEPYFSTKPDGTGLGLAIAQQIVADHGGYLRIGQNEPHGVVVSIELPMGDTLTLASETKGGEMHV